MLKRDLSLDVLDDLETLVAWRKALPKWEPGLVVEMDEVAPAVVASEYLDGDERVK